MKSYDATLGGQDATVFFPDPDTFDASTFRAVFPAGQLYGLDVETTALGPLAQFDPDFAIRTMQFATAGYAWVLDVSDPEMLEAGRELLNDPETGFCSHTDMDVLSVLAVYGVDIAERNIDTRMLARLVDAQKFTAKDLKSLTDRHIGPELSAAETALHEHFRRDLWEGKKGAAAADVDRHGWNTVAIDEPSFVVYAGLDAIACRRLVDILSELHGAAESLLDTEQWLSVESIRLKARGYRVDQELLTELRGEAVAATDSAAAAIAAITDGIKPTSPKIQEWLGEHGVDWSVWPGDRTPTGNPSLAKTNLVHIESFPLDEQAAEVYGHMRHHRAYQDIRNKTKGVAEGLTADGRVHATLHSIGAVTARMSSAGPNMQNFSKTEPRLRGLFLPDPGYVLITCDFSQVELRVVAALADERKMIDVILAGGDLHDLTVDELAVMGVIITRDIGKMANFLIVYGGGGKALHEQGRIERSYADEIVRVHKERYEAVAEFGEMLSRLTRDIRTTSGRRIPVPPGRAYANINYEVQSVSRDLVVYAWQRFDAMGTSGRVWFPVHDELIIECPAEDAELVCKAAEEAMSFDYLSVPIAATAHVCLDEHGVSRWTK